MDRKIELSQSSNVQTANKPDRAPKIWQELCGQKSSCSKDSFFSIVFPPSFCPPSSLLSIMQSRFDPDSANSLQLSFDGPLSAFQFAGNLGVRNPLKLEQHNSLHRVVRNRVEQLRTTFRDFGQFIGRRLVANNGIDTGSTKVNKSRLTTHGSASTFLTMDMPLLRGDFP